MQIQANAAGVRVVRSAIAETTALGAAYLAGLSTGFYKDVDAHWKADRVFQPREDRTALRQAWREEIARVKHR